MPANVRIHPNSYSKLRQLADDAGVTMPEVLAEAIDEQYRTRFLDDCNRAYGRLKADPKKWKQELAERKAWERTLGGGSHSSRLSRATGQAAGRRYSLSDGRS